MVDSAPVLNEPIVPVPPPAGEVQEVLLVDDQFMFVFAFVFGFFFNLSDDKRETKKREYEQKGIDILNMYSVYIDPVKV